MLATFGYDGYSEVERASGTGGASGTKDLTDFEEEREAWLFPETEPEEDGGETNAEEQVV